MTNYIEQAIRQNNVTRITSNVLKTLTAQAGYDSVEWIRYTAPGANGKNVYGVRIHRYLKETGSAKQTAEYLNNVLQDMETAGII